MWAVNDRVLFWREQDELFFPGTVRLIDGDRFFVILDNGADDWASESELAAFNLAPGTSLVIANQGEGDSVRATLLRHDGQSVLAESADGTQIEVSLREVGIVRNQSPTTKSRDWQVGDRVFARWGGDLFWYPGTIFALLNDGYRILFDDQDQAVVGSDDLLPLVVHEGDTVLCRPKFEPNLRYLPAEVTRVSGEVIDVVYHEVELEEQNTQIGRVRIRRSLSGLVIWEEGDRILAFGRDGFWYPAVVLVIDGDRIFVNFLGSRHAWLLPEEIQPLRFRIGQRVQCRKDAGEEFLDADILEVSGEVLRVRYANGDEEQSLIRLTRAPARDERETT
jgi:hypothetical protein